MRKNLHHVEGHHRSALWSRSENTNCHNTIRCYIYDKQIIASFQTYLMTGMHTSLYLRTTINLACSTVSFMQVTELSETNISNNKILPRVQSDYFPILQSLNNIAPYLFEEQVCTCYFNKCIFPKYMEEIFYFAKQCNLTYMYHLYECIHDMFIVHTNASKQSSAMLLSSAYIVR